MKNTIIPKYEYIIKRLKPSMAVSLYDGVKFIMNAELKPHKDFIEEKDCNEMFNWCETFVANYDGKQVQFVYWRDEEIDEDYLTIIKEI